MAKLNGKLIASVRRVNRLSQTEMGEKLGVSRTLISMIEIDQKPISRRLDKRINQVFGEDYIAKVKALTEVLTN